MIQKEFGFCLFFRCGIKDGCNLLHIPLLLATVGVIVKKAKLDVLPNTLQFPSF